jgi:hypothetical protein
MSRKGFFPADMPTDPDLYWPWYWEREARFKHYCREKARHAPLKCWQLAALCHSDRWHREDRSPNNAERIWLRTAIERLRWYRQLLQYNQRFDPGTKQLKSFEEPFPPESFLDQIDELRVMASMHCVDPRCAGRCSLLYFKDHIPGRTQFLSDAFTFDRRSIRVTFNVVTMRIAGLDVEV